MPVELELGVAGTCLFQMVIWPELGVRGGRREAHGVKESLMESVRGMLWAMHTQFQNSPFMGSLEHEEEDDIW